MIRSRRRPLSAEERRLWAEVARSIAPLPGRVHPGEDPVPAPAPPPGPGDGGQPSKQVGPQLVPSERPRPALPPLAPLETKTIRALSRGRMRPDSVIDLHGLTQADAHSALLGFLARSQAAGHRLVLVVTGKGRPSDSTRQSERGILRRMVPHWLAMPQARTFVVGWDEAGPRQGGAGALYVRLRRRGGG
jgi:DNA-nicking Smr family endonuclease